VDVVFKGKELPPGPWLYRKRLQKPRGAAPPAGAFVAVRDERGTLLGRGLYNRKSEIAVRVLGGADAPAELEELLTARVQAAARLREDVLGLGRRTDAYRLVNAEGDGLSGLVVDRYGDTCVASLYSIGWVHSAETLERVLRRTAGAREVLFRADERSQKLEGFRLPDPEPGQEVVVQEGRLRFKVDLSEGHKTGLFLDQRDNRARLAGMSRGRRVLDLCTNAGGFALSCRGPGRARRVTAVDLDEKALAAARANAKINDLRIGFEHADLFPWLRDHVDAGDRWDVVILDPPKLAKGRGDLEQAANRYRDMNRLALQACAPGAIMFTCSCSGAVSLEHFWSLVRAAAHQAGRTVQVLEVRGAASDHPVLPTFPEGAYLKGLLLHVV